MLILLPVFCFLLLWSGLCRLSGRGLAWSALAGVTLMGVYASVALEVLSLWRGIGSGAVAVVWVLGLAICGVVFGVGCKKDGLGVVARVRAWGREQDGVTLGLAGVGAVFAGVVGVVAVVAPPNVWDGLTYHLPRVMHWLQNGTLEHYPSHILRQLWMNPFAEEAVLHAYALWGGDRFVNCVQWLGYVFGALAAARAAGLLGAGGRGQAMAGVFALSIPIVALQASGPQTDVVTGAWLLIAACFGLGLYQRRGGTWGALICDAGLVGAALGLACLTKGTSYLLGVGIAVGLAVWVLRGNGALADEREEEVGGREGILEARGQNSTPAGRAVPPGMRVVGALVIVLVFAVLNGPFIGRNVGLFGKPFGPGVDDQRNTHMSPMVTFSNAVRTGALQMAPPGEGGTVALGRAVIGLHEALGLDVNDPGTSFDGRPFQLYPMRFHEDTTPNPAHLLLGLACVVLVLSVKGNRENRELVFWALAVVGGLVVYFTIIRWQPWSSRLMAPSFLLIAPVVGVVLSRARLALPGLVLMGVCVVSGAVAVTLSETHPIWRSDGLSVFEGTRMDHYIVRLPERAMMVPVAVREQTDGKANVGTLGWMSQEEDFEYLAWLARDVFGHPGARVEHVGVENASKDAPVRNEMRPEVVVVDMRGAPR
jgi:hypothetical protein